MNTTYECLCHPDENPIPAWTYLGLINYVCPVCRESATLVKRESEHCKYFQHGETGRTCATLHNLKGEWFGISKDAYFEIEKQFRENPPITPSDISRTICQKSGRIAMNEEG